MEKTKPLLLIGAGGHAKVIAEIATQNNYHIEAIFADNNKYNFDKYVGRYDSNLFAECHLILAIGDNNLREKISQSVNHSLEILISKYAIISNTSSIDKGTVVFHNSVIQADTKIGKHCIVNTNATIEHDCEIGNFVHIAPNACICGEVTIGDNTLIGANSTILPGIKIGKNCIVGAGSVVTKSIEDGTKVAGNPARIIN